MTTTYSGTQVALKLERLLVEGKIEKEYIGALNGGDADQNFYTKRFPITDGAAKPGGVEGTVMTTYVHTTTAFKTDLPSAVADYYNGMTIRFLTGALAVLNQMKVISAFDESTKVITSAAFTVAPSDDDTFIIEPSVDVFTDDGGPGTWSEYTEDGLAYQINALTGEVRILQAENQAGNANERISISYYQSEEPAVGQNVSIEHTQELTEIYKLGSIHPQELKEGTISISGTIGLIWADRSMMGTFLSISDFYKKLAAYSFYLYPNGYVNLEPYIKLSGVKFSGGTLGVDIDGPLALDVSYKGLAFETGTLSI